MLRRRPVRRLIGRLAGHKPMQAQVFQALGRAHRLMESRQFAQAFPIFQRLADGAAERGMPVQAANLYLKAAHARLEMGGADEAAELAHRAIQLFADAGQEQRLRALLPQLTRALEEKGHHGQAVTLRAEMEALLGGLGPALQAAPAQRGTLPAKCPSCSGPVRADEVEWIDEHSAECAYCGSVIQAQF